MPALKAYNPARPGAVAGEQLPPASMPPLIAFVAAISRACGALLHQWTTRTTVRFVSSTFDKIYQEYNKLSAKKAVEIKAKERSRYIDEQLEEIGDERRYIVHVVLLGMSICVSYVVKCFIHCSMIGLPESGKSTLLKQMKFNFGHKLSDEELLNYRNSVYRKLVQDAQTLLLRISNYEDKSMMFIRDEAINKLMSYTIDQDPTFVIEQDIADTIRCLYNDSFIQRVFTKGDGSDVEQET